MDLKRNFTKMHKKRSILKCYSTENDPVKKKQFAYHL